MAVDTLIGAGVGGYDTAGKINESVLQTIYDLSKRPLPLQDRIGRGTHGREYNEWTMRRLASGNKDNARIDGSDPTDDDNKIGIRMGNHSQISAKTVKVSDRVRASDSIGVGDELRKQIEDRAWELRYDIEASMLSNNDSVADSGVAAGKSAGLVAYAKAEDVDGNASAHVVSISSTGVFDSGGWNSGTNIIDGATFNTGASAALAQADIDGVILAMHVLNADPTVAMAVPKVIQKISKYFFKTTAEASTMYAQTGNVAVDRVAQSAVNVYHTDFGTTLMLESNVHMPSEDAGTMTDGTTDTDVLLIMDPSFLELSTLMSFRTEEHAKTGLATEMEHKVDWSLVVKNWEAVGAIMGIEADSAVTPT